MCWNRRDRTAINFLNRTPGVDQCAQIQSEQLNRRRLFQFHAIRLTFIERKMEECADFFRRLGAQLVRQPGPMEGILKSVGDSGDHSKLVALSKIICLHGVPDQSILLFRRERYGRFRRDGRIRRNSGRFFRYVCVGRLRARFSDGGLQAFPCLYALLRISRTFFVLCRKKRTACYGLFPKDMIGYG